MARLWAGEGLPGKLTSSTTSLLLHEPLVLVFSDEVALPFPELHNFPRAFKPRKQGISAQIAKKWEIDTRLPRSCASPQLFWLLIVFFPLTAQQRRLRKMYLSDYLQGLRYCSVYTDDQVKKKRWLLGTQDYFSLRHEWIVKNQIISRARERTELQ